MLSQYQLVTAAQRTQVFHNCENLVDLVACEFDEMPERGGEEKELQLELELVHPLRDKPYRVAAWQRSILTVIMINLNH